ncbi:hypothetical protein [Corallococcus terminator]|nr:hypothetical protein [Corallococcus terminator]
MLDPRFIPGAVGRSAHREVTSSPGLTTQADKIEASLRTQRLLTATLWP